MTVISAALFTACPNGAKDSSPENIVQSLTVTVTGGEHATVMQPSVTVPKGSLWSYVLAEAVQSVSYDAGWDLKCRRLDNSAGIMQECPSG